MDRYEPAFVQSVDEIEFIKYVKDVDDQDVLDSLSLMRRRAGLSVAAPPPPLQIDSGYDDSQSDNDEDDSVSRYCDDHSHNQAAIMACYRVQIQSDNGLALTEHNKFEVSRYAYDETLQQDYLEEFDFVSVDEDDQENNDDKQKFVKTRPYPEQERQQREGRPWKQIAREHSSEVEHCNPSFLSSLFTFLVGNRDRIEGWETCDQEQGKYDTTLQNLYLSKVDSSSSSLLSSRSQTETAEFEGTLDSRSSVFSDIH